MITVLSVAYAMGVVGPDSSGGAEQVLSHLDAALIGAGHRSLVVAIEGSRTEGRLIAVPRCATGLDAAAIADQTANHRRAVARAIAEFRPDVVHYHGLDFNQMAMPDVAPALVTLHCPADWYAHDAVTAAPPNIWFNAVSVDQHERWHATGRLLAPVLNGIRTEAFTNDAVKTAPPLMLGRVAPEKGVHLALRACHAAGLGLTVAGPLEGYPGHRAYFATELEPLLDRHRWWIGPVGFERKRRLLAEARCLIVASPQGETSSLVAREALASGTPVVALDRGAMAEVVDHGRTGLLVDTPDDLPTALHAVTAIDPRACRETALARFDWRVMAQHYFEHYRTLLAMRRGAAA